MQLFRSEKAPEADGHDEGSVEDVARWPTDRGPAAVLPGSGREQPRERPRASRRRAPGPTTSPRAGEPCGTAA